VIEQGAGGYGVDIDGVGGGGVGVNSGGADGTSRDDEKDGNSDGAGAGGATGGRVGDDRDDDSGYTGESAPEQTAQRPSIDVLSIANQRELLFDLRYLFRHTPYFIRL